jgi:hypothetical protein
MYMGRAERLDRGGTWDRVLNVGSVERIN